MLLADYELRAAALLDAFDTGTPEAMERHWRLTWHRRGWAGMRSYVLADLGRHAGDPEEITLDDARWLVAREHGFADWAALERFVASIEPGAELLARPMEVRSSGSDGRSLATPRDVRRILEALEHPEATALDAHGEMTDALLVRLAHHAPVDRLESLALGGCRAVTDEGIRHLARFTRLRHLDLSGTSVTDRGVAAVLGAFPQLERLWLAWTSVGDAGVAALHRDAPLADLALLGSAAGDGALGTLAGRDSLRQLSTGREVTDAGLARLHDIPAFATWQGEEPSFALLSPDVRPNRLTLRGRITDAGLAALRGLDGLFALDIGDERLGLGPLAVEHLASLPRLGWLSFDATDASLPAIARLPMLRALLCQDTSASDDGFQALAGATSLEMLWGRRCEGLGRRGFQALAATPRLRSLSVSCKHLGDDGASALVHFPSLAELMPIDLPDDGYRHVARCGRLESLTLMYCRETSDVATMHIAQLPALRRYFASYTRATDRTPELLATIGALEEVTFDSCAGITDRGVAALARLPRLRTLRVSGRGISAAVGAPFAPHVRVHRGL